MIALTEAAAWREIAERVIDGDYCRGLCTGVWSLDFNRAICSETSRLMLDRLRQYVDSGTYVYPRGTEYTEACALAALWLAHEAEDEP